MAALHGVTDALAGKRIDEARGIAGEQGVSASGRIAKISKRDEVALDLEVGALEPASLHQRVQLGPHVGVIAVEAADADGERFLLGKHPAVTPATRAEINLGQHRIDAGRIARDFGLQREADVRGIERAAVESARDRAVHAVGADEVAVAECFAVQREL